MRRRHGILLAIPALLALPALATATTLSLQTLVEGNTIIQVTEAAAGATDGGLATADTRTIYYFTPDFGDPPPNTHDFTGTTWPYVILDGVLDVDPGITASVTTTATAGGDIVLINGNPVYQFISDTSPLAAGGNFGPWFYIEPDGSATQETVPEPAGLLLLGSGLLALAGLRSRR